MTKIPQIQIARAIAALMVTYFHSYMALRAFNVSASAPIPFINEYGYLGVNLFFIISGYVIAIVIDRPNFSRLEFCTNRVFRLYPVYFLLLGISILLIDSNFTILYKSPNSTSELFDALSFFPQKNEPIFAVTWSLEHEIVFYVIAMIFFPLSGQLGCSSFSLGSDSWVVF